MKSSPLRTALLATLLVTFVSASACADTEEVAGPDAVRLEEWVIELGLSERPAGPVSFDVQNVGTMRHELVVMRTKLAPEALPVSSGRVDESQVEVVGEVENLERREKATLSVELEPGRYVLVCNLSGHYALGMRAELRVD